MSKEIARRPAAGGINTQPPRTILLDDIQMMWPNFAGEAGRYNNAGKRNFVAFLPADAAADMEATGYNIKYLEPREEGQERQAFVKVNVNFVSRNPPEIFTVNSRGKRKLDAGTAMILDWAKTDRADIIVSRYERTDEFGKTTVTPYLQTMYAFLHEDELAQRYADIPEIGASEEEGAQDLVLYEVTSDEEIEAEKYAVLEGTLED